MINKLISELIQYGINRGLIAPDDIDYSTNKLLELFELNDFTPASIDSVRPVNEILEDMISYALEKGIMKDNMQETKDLFDTKIMGLITPPPSEVRRNFREKYSRDPKEATDYFYDFSRATNYIRDDRIAKDVRWKTDTDFGTLDISINLSKPEKDPRAIAAAAKAAKSGYPACLLCKENEGYAGHLTHPARQNHRIIPITLDGTDYFLQYSPYVYYNEHCIVFNKEHTPMKINRETFAKLMDFIEQFPHYTVGSNADLPIVGGSILSHDHFQGGCYEFPMVRAPYLKEFTIPDFPDVHAGIINWPLSTIRLQSDNKNSIIELSDRILKAWRGYTDEEAFIFSETDGTPHNTITPIARSRNGRFEMDLVLRNNITTDEFPMGVYHPHQEYHHIKKENIGLIEVMGLAILPARLKKEMAILETAVLENKDLREIPECASHADWAYEWLSENNVTSDNIHSVIETEIGKVFAHVLECAGVYKLTDKGLAAFDRFIKVI